MLFNSAVFLFAFLPVVFVIYAALELLGQQRAMLYWLIAASLFFYAYWAWQLIFVLLASIAFNYGFSLLLANCGRDSATYRRGLLAVGVTVNLGALAFFKYANFFILTADRLIGTAWPIQEIVLPLAISFFTFQQIAFLVDVAGQPAAVLPFERYCFFVTYFPHLIAGPICYRRDIIPQLGRTRDLPTLADASSSALLCE